MAEEALQQVLENLVDSSDDEEIILPLPQLIINNDDNNDVDMFVVFHPMVKANRIHHARVERYIKTIVMNYNNYDFIMHFRLSRELAHTLIERFTVSEIFTSLQEHAGYVPITLKKHVLAYLWFVGHESGSYRDIADRFEVTISVLHTIITRVTNFLLSIAPSVIKFPSLEERERTKTFYIQEKGFPGVIGAVDGSRVRIDKPIEDHDSYINRTHYFSIQMQGVVNHERKFKDVFVGYPGSVHDARVFRESPLYNCLDEPCGGLFKRTHMRRYL